MTAEGEGLLVNPYKTFTQRLFHKNTYSEGGWVGHFTWDQVEKVTLD